MTGSAVKHKGVAQPGNIIVPNGKRRKKGLQLKFFFLDWNRVRLTIDYDCFASYPNGTGGTKRNKAFRSL
jgi:hypothetical protein